MVSDSILHTQKEESQKYKGEDSEDNQKRAGALCFCFLPAGLFGENALLDPLQQRYNLLALLIADALLLHNGGGIFLLPAGIQSGPGGQLCIGKALTDAQGTDAI